MEFYVTVAYDNLKSIGIVSLRFQIPGSGKTGMMENNKYLRLFPFLCFVCVFPILALCSANSAATLYEHSLEKFQAKAEKASSKEFIFKVLGDSTFIASCRSYMLEE